MTDRRERVLLEQQDRVYRLALRLTGGCREEAEDVAQEAMITALRQLPLFMGRSHITTWIHTITVRTWRKRRNRQPGDGQEVPLSDHDGSLPNEWDGLVTRIQLDAAICTLPDALREAFVLVKAEGYTAKEAAAILDIPQGTVQWQVHEACQRLRKVLEEADESK